MSTDRQRVKRAIQRIAVQAPELQSFLDDAESKGGKAKSAGVGSSSEAHGDRVCCDGSTGSANPGTGERDPDADGAGQDGLNGDDPADLTSGDGTLSGVTDCATGEPICFDGAGFIPPDGWDEPNLPPVDDLYEEGLYWSGTDSTGTYTGASPEQIGRLKYGDNNGEDLCYNPQDGNDCYQIFWYNPSFSGGACNFSGLIVCPSACGDSTEDYCTEVPRTDDEWPSDGCTNLSIVNGTIVGSKHDPENDGSYSAPRDSIDLCSGGDQISLAPAANGGWKTINSTTDNGYLYDSSGRQIAHIDGNEYSDPAI